MNKTIIKITRIALVFLVSSSLFAQQKLTKVSQSIKVNKDVTIDLNTSHCNIVFDTWNKSTVEIEAYIEGEDLSKEELQEALKNWDVDVDGSQDHVSISTKEHSYPFWSKSNNADNDVLHAVLNELKFELADFPEMDFNFNFEVPELPEMPEMPELPELPEGVNKIKFDYKAYKKDGEKYLEEWSQNFESKYGDDYAKKMEAWGEKFGKEWGKKYGKQMEAWAKKFEGKWDSEEFEQKMEAWSDRFEERMEGQTERLEAQKERLAAHKAQVKERAKAHKARVKELVKVKKARLEEHKKHAKERKKLSDERHVLIERLVNKKSNSKVKKTIIIKMPKGAKLKVNVRHGEIEFAANIDNLKADLSHTKFTALSVNGSSTSINASYSPVYVTHWNLGELNLKHVENAELNNVRQLVLNSNSSNAKIKNLLGSAIIDGSIGDLKILKIDNNFNNLNIILQNSDAVITLPKVTHNLQYKGTRTRFKHPEKPTDNNISSFTTNTTETNKTIVVNAKYSNVIMQ